MTDYIEDAPPPRRRIHYDPNQVGGEAAYQAARRHSRLVGRLKFILPALAVGGAVVFWASARIIPSDLANLISMASIDVKSNSVVMDKPHISGFEGTRRAYEVKADSATQSLSDPKVLTFNTIDAHIGLDGAGIATVDAKTGVYDGNNNTLQLKDGIAIQTTTGYSAAIEAAAVDLAKGTLSSSPADRDPHQGRHAARQLHGGQRPRQAHRVSRRRFGHLPAAGRTGDRAGAA